jgi:DNA-binding NarL/FixJ family response regulator
VLLWEYQLRIQFALWMVFLLMTQVRVLMVDDSPEFLQAASHFLEADPCIQVIGSFNGAEEALEHLPGLEPDLVLMDLAMPGMNGLEAVRLLKSQELPPRVIILTMYDVDEFRSAAPQIHADGFVTKSEFGAALLPLIRCLFDLPDPLEQDETNNPC